MQCLIRKSGLHAFEFKTDFILIYPELAAVPGSANKKRTCDILLAADAWPHF